MRNNELARYSVEVSCGYSNDIPMSEAYTIYARTDNEAMGNAVDMFYLAYEDLLCEYDAAVAVDILDKSTKEVKLPTYRYKVHYTIRDIARTSGYVFVDAEDSEEAQERVIDHIDDPDSDICRNRVDDKKQESDPIDTEVVINEIFIVDKNGNETSVY